MSEVTLEKWQDAFRPETLPLVNSLDQGWAVVRPKLEAMGFANSTELFAACWKPEHWLAVWVAYMETHFEHAADNPWRDWRADSLRTKEALSELYELRQVSNGIRRWGGKW